jgi:polysaccharide export outer membrane protein
MRSLIMSAFLAAILVFYLSGQEAPPPQQQAQTQDNRPVNKSVVVPESISPMIPINPSAATDPGRMAGPAGTMGVPKTSAAIDTRTYVIGSDDELSINVFENPAFNVMTETVRPDGKITMPLIGELQSSGKTPDQLKNEITENLAQNYMNLPPHVSVIVVQVKSKNYYINGEVLKPGKYPLTVPTTVMQALVNAGGFKDFANKSHIKVQRGSKFFNFNYKEVSKGKKLDQNMQLEPDDQIFVN